MRLPLRARALGFLRARLGGSVADLPPEEVPAARERSGRIQAGPAGRAIVGSHDRRVVVEDTAVTTPEAVLPVRVYRPPQTATVPAPLVVNFHGGGYVQGDLDQSDWFCGQVALLSGAVVVSVDYRLAPEHPWPAAPDDCEAAALWLAENSADRFGTSQFSIIGFSAGATLAVATLLRLRDRGIGVVDTAVLQFGTYDLSGQTPAGRLIADEYFLEAYAGSTADRTRPDLSPIYADLAGLPPVLMVVGDGDVLLHDNLAMAARLSAAGVEVDLRVYPESPHGFTAHPTPMARAALDDIEAWLGDRPAPSVRRAP